MATLPRLDILLYAHDGRGLGHASRSIAIGLALRRLYPSLRILLLTGCKVSQELIGPGLLDWIKLPSYETTVINGRSQGIDGNSAMTDTELGSLRGTQIRDIIRAYRPWVILADHSPQGKHRELLPALAEFVDGSWVLGIRAIPGDLAPERTALAAAIFAKYYRSILWYGDSRVLGSDQMTTIAGQYGTVPVECGYVSRMTELMKMATAEYAGPALAGTIAIPWIGENSIAFLSTLATVLQRLGPSHGHWQLFIEDNHPQSQQIYAFFRTIPYCSLEKPGQKYVSALMRSKTALIYGGYNSLMDVLSLSLPTLVILRDMDDNEQQLHLAKIIASATDNLNALPEQCGQDSLFAALLALLSGGGGKPPAIALNGSESAARYLRALLNNPG
jgi:predicted glycosyltransferase